MTVTISGSSQPTSYGICTPNSKNGSIYVAPLESIKLTATSDTDKTFVGWYVDGILVSNNPVYIYNNDKAYVHIEAKWS